MDKREFRDVTYQDYVGFLIYFGSVAVTVKEEVCPIFPLKHKIIKYEIHSITANIVNIAANVNIATNVKIANNVSIDILRSF